MNRSNLIAMLSGILITSLIAWWWCKKCPPCPTPEPNPSCDTCYCATTPLLDAEGNWCCGDRLTKQCIPDSDRFCDSMTTSTDFGNADIRIEKLEMRREGGNVVTDIIITNEGDDSAPCAKLEVLLPVTTKFIEFVYSDGSALDWEFYDGYVRVNLGQLESNRGGYSREETHRKVTMVTTFNCFKEPVNSGIAAFVYSITPDPCLANNYAYGYYQIYDLSGCSTPEIKDLIKK